MAHIDAGKTTTDRAHPLLHRASPTRWARSTTAPPPWTGWSRSRSAASPSPPPPPPASGATTASTSSTPRATWTSPSRWSARCACWTARSRVFCAVGGVEPQSETVWRQADKYRVPAHRLRQQDGPRRAPTSAAAVDMIQRAAGRQCRCPSRSPSAPRTTSRASSTWSSMKAMLLGPKTLGAQLSRPEIPAEHLAERPSSTASELIEAARRDRRRARWRSTWRARRSPTSEILPRIRKATLASKIVPVLLRRRLQEQGRPAAARRRRRLPALARSTSPPVEGIDPDTDRAEARARRRRRARSAALAFKIMTDPYVGHAHLLPRLLRHARAGRLRLQRHARARRSASAGSCKMHANKREDIEEV